MSNALPQPQAGKRIDMQELFWWHEAGHVWACWFAKIRVKDVNWQRVDHDHFPEGWPLLRNLMAGIAAVSLRWNLSFEEAFLFGGAVAGDGPAAVGQVLESKRPGDQRVPYEDEIPDLWHRIGKAFDEV